MLLAPGAGADRDQPTLVAIDDALTAEGWAVERMDFPYRVAGRRAPDRAPVLIEAVRAGASALSERTGIPPQEIVLGGRSMGGRMCSLAVAQGLPAAGLALVSYPLRPPGRPEKQVERTAHFPDLRVPCLFVSGTRDPFGSPSELETATAAIAGPVTHQWVDGGDHALRGRDAPIVRGFCEWIRSLGVVSTTENVRSRAEQAPDRELGPTQNRGST